MVILFGSRRLAGHMPLPSRACAALVVGLSIGLCAAPARADDVDQTRLTMGPGSLRVNTQAWAARFDLRMDAAGIESTTLRRQRWQLLGDYYFARFGGLRATGGLLGQTALPVDAGVNAARAAGLQATRHGPTLGERAAAGQLWPTVGEAGTATYFGLGYSSGSAGWGLSADFGLLALRESSGVRLDRNGTGSADWPRELRLRPMLQLGVSYAF